MLSEYLHGDPAAPLSSITLAKAGLVPSGHGAPERLLRGLIFPGA